MEKDLKYDNLLKAYRRGELDRGKLETLIFTGVRKQVVRAKPKGMDYDTCNDFVSWFYPRLSRAIDRYRDTGFTFDTYLQSLIQLSAREFCFRQKDRRIIERAWWDAKAEEEEMCAEEEPPYFEPQEDFKKVRNRKQVLTLLLKSYHYLSDDYLERAAPAIKIDKEELRNMVDSLRNQRLRQEEEIHDLRERVHSQFYRCLAFEKRMHSVPHGSAHRARMEKSLEGARKRLTAMRARLDSIRIEAPNWQIANIIGVPKGTVDANLFALKQTRTKAPSKHKKK